MVKYPYPTQCDDASRHQMHLFSTVKSVGSLEMGAVLFEFWEMYTKKRPSNAHVIPTGPVKTIFEPP